MGPFQFGILNDSVITLWPYLAAQDRGRHQFCARAARLTRLPCAEPQGSGSSRIPPAPSPEQGGGGGGSSARLVPAQCAWGGPAMAGSYERLSPSGEKVGAAGWAGEAGPRRAGPGRAGSPQPSLAQPRGSCRRGRRGRQREGVVRRAAEGRSRDGVWCRFPRSPVLTRS